MRNGEVKLSLFADNMILYIENPKNSTKKELLETIKTNTMKFTFLYTNNEASEREIKKTIPFTIAKIE